MQTVLVFTSAKIQSRTLFRASRLELELRPGRGRIWVDVSLNRRYTEVWQQHLQHLQAQGRVTFPRLPWSTTDLYVAARAEDLLLDGRSASLPLFLTWLSLLTSTPLPDPFFAAGVCLDRDSLVPAPAEFIQGKLEVAQKLVSQQIPPPSAPVPFWYPAGSEVNPERVPLLRLRPVSSLAEAAERLFGLPLTLQEALSP